MLVARAVEAALQLEGRACIQVSLAGMADNLDMEMEKRFLEYSQGFGPSSRVDFILVRTLGWPIICIL